MSSLCAARSACFQSLRHGSVSRPAWLLVQKLKLGLDLQGGVHHVLGVQFPPDASRSERNAIASEVLETIEHRVNELGVAEPLLASQANGAEVLVQLPAVTEVERAKRIISTTGILEMKIVERGPATSRDSFLVGGDVPFNTEIVAARQDPGNPERHCSTHILPRWSLGISVSVWNRSDSWFRRHALDGTGV